MTVGEVKDIGFEVCLGEALPLTGVDYLLSLDPEVFLDPPLEVYHVRHKQVVLHAVLIATDQLRFGLEPDREV